MQPGWRHRDAAAAVADRGGGGEGGVRNRGEVGGAERRRWPGSYWKSTGRLLPAMSANIISFLPPGPQEARAGDLGDTAAKSRQPVEKRKKTGHDPLTSTENTRKGLNKYRICKVLLQPKIVCYLKIMVTLFKYRLAS